MTPRPKHLELKKDQALTVHWLDGASSVYPIAYLRKMSPSAETRALREEMAKNPLTVLPSSADRGNDSPLVATGAQMVGNYAIRITFSDGHDTGIYSWEYLRQIAPPQPPEISSKPSKRPAIPSKPSKIPSDRPEPG